MINKKTFISISIVIFLTAILAFPLLANGQKDAPKPDMQKPDTKQPEILLVSKIVPITDGVITDKEYALQIDFPKIKIYLTRDEKTLYFAIAADAAGWIAVGFGSTKMDKAKIIMGYEKEDKATVDEFTGIGHKHAEPGGEILKKSALSEADGKTIFEGEVDAEKIIAKDQNALDFIVACSDADNFTGFHKAKAGYSVKLK